MSENNNYVHTEPLTPQPSSSLTVSSTANGQSLGSYSLPHFATPLLDYSLRIQKLHPDAIIPTKAHDTDLGYDLYALEDVEILHGVVTKVRTGIACGLPYGFGALIRDRSSVATKQEIFTVAGVIDNGYRGEIIVAFYNPGKLKQSTKTDPDVVFGGSTGYNAGRANYSSLVTDVRLTGTKRFGKGDKIAQLILTQINSAFVREVETLDETPRNTNGFGSSGK